jgi:uncharacterized protein (TIGR00725 family)
MRVSVIGGGSITDEQAAVAAAVGREIGSRGHTLVCGGRGGAMAAACRGASEAGGRTVGILPGTDPAAANEHVDVPIVTGLGSMRNALVVRNGDAAVAIDGAYGTLSEIALALDAGLPVVGFDTHDVDGVVAVDDPAAALDRIERAVE